MQLAVDRSGDVRILRVREAKLTYPNLSAFLAEVRRLVEEGTRKLVIDLQQVGYVDSATIGCLMDVRRLLQEQALAQHRKHVRSRHRAHRVVLRNEPAERNARKVVEQRQHGHRQGRARRQSTTGK